MVPTEYRKHEIEGINIYLYKDAVIKNDLIEISLAKSASDFANKDFDITGLEI
nr:hypothetical protein [Tissierella sp.]